MNQKKTYFIKVGKLFPLLIALFFSYSLQAQLVSSLTYPTPTVAVANVTNVYLAPNLAGNPTGFSITPALPAGLLLNSSTGVISGVATAASPATNYTVTATGASNSTTGNLSIQITSNYFNNNFSPLNFGGPGVTVIDGTTGATISNTTTNAVGRNAGEKVVYKNIVTVSGTSLDCIVTTEAVTVASWQAYDQDAATGGGFADNEARFFSPQVTFPTNNTAELIYNFQFILGGTYSTATQSGLNVVLRDVNLNSYDIDGNGQTNSAQSTEFGGFSSYQLGNPTTISSPTVNNGLTTFKSSTDANSTSVTDPKTRIKVSYNNMSNFRVRFTGQGSAYFFLDFGSGPGFNTAPPAVESPIIDLNTNVIGINNANAGCGQQLNFTPAGQKNITSTTSLTQLTVSFPTADIKNAGDEELWITGVASNPPLKISLTATMISNFTLGSVNYNGNTVVTAGGITTFTFKKSIGTITESNAEDLLDAFRYNNKSVAPTPGERHFTVNIFNTAFKSPDAVYTALLDCVSISGFIYHDNNGMVDNLVNATGASQFTANQLYAVLTNPTTNTVLDVKGIAAGGSYNFGTVSTGTYAIYVSTTPPVIGSTFTAATFPANYVPTGEHLGAGPGDDLVADGKLIVTVGSLSITSANFGLQIPPTSSDNTISNINNPEGLNNYQIPSNSFTVADADGSVKYITINSFPTGANYLKVGNTYYTSGGTCPPQITCMPWPGTLNVPFSGGNPTETISVDPSFTGPGTVPINFTAFDDANMSAPASTLTLNFIDGSKTISGNVWDDANGNGIKEGSELLVAPAAPGETLYAVIIQTNNTYSGQPTIFSSAIVDATNGYSLTNVPANNNYVIKLVSLPSAPVAGALSTSISPNLADNWVGVSTNANGTIVASQSTNNLQIAINNLTANQSNQNFGIEQLPNSDDVNVSITKKVFIGDMFILDSRTYTVGQNSNTALVQFPPLSGNDPEDGALGGGKTLKITTVPANASLTYNGSVVTAGQVITNYNPSLLSLTITGGGSSTIVFNYAFLDAAGQLDPTPATYTINYVYTLPVQLISFTARGDNGDAVLNWSTSTEQNSAGFGVEHSSDGNTWNTLGFVNSKSANGNSNQKLSYSYTDRSITNGTHYYRLKQTDLNGGYGYSDVAKLDNNSSNAAFRVYPNPSSSYIFIEYTGANKTPVRIIDMSGRVMKSLFTTGAKTRVETNDFPAGTYIISIDGKTKKFTINK